MQKQVSQWKYVDDLNHPSNVLSGAIHACQNHECPGVVSRAAQKNSGSWLSSGSI
jgi:hypothetical protein